tara:strand:- start:898 stop:1449 length:552 start_codon:yes stop_codon:yes gene_type:complete
MKTKIFILSLLIMVFFKNNVHANYEKLFYDFKIKDISGNELDFKDFKNKIVLMVNTASYCGFTKQYDDLQFIWDKFRNNNFVVLGIPSNSFNQEKSTNKEVKEFCEFNFNITFPITEITEVKGENAHPVYKWAIENYGSSAKPKWNFHKILINKYGKVEETYSSLTKPTSKKILSKIEELIYN